MSDLEDLEAKITLMRKLGVTECEGIKLGPAPQTPPEEETKEEMMRKINMAAQRRHDVMFAASSTRPKLVVIK